MYEVKFAPGMDVGEAAKALVDIAGDGFGPCFGMFNDCRLEAGPGDSPISVERVYWDHVEQKKREYEASPQFKIDQENRRKRNEIARKARRDGILPFSIADSEKWEKTVAANKEEYGAVIIRYAARWANYMEKEIASGSTVADAAKKTEFAADLEGLSGFQVDAALITLIGTWKHGEELKKWRDSQRMPLSIAEIDQ